MNSAFKLMAHVANEEAFEELKAGLRGSYLEDARPTHYPALIYSADNPVKDHARDGMAGERVFLTLERTHILALMQGTW